MKLFILFSLLVCLTGCSAQQVKDVKKDLFPRHAHFASILSEGK